MLPADVTPDVDIAMACPADIPLFRSNGAIDVLCFSATFFFLFYKFAF